MCRVSKTVGRSFMLSVALVPCRFDDLLDDGLTFVVYPHVVKNFDCFAPRVSVLLGLKIHQENNVHSCF